MNLIVAVDQNWAIGQNGDQLIYLPADLKRFQALTTGHAVILGRKTLATFPSGRPLKNRKNLILSHTPGLMVEDAQVFEGLEALLAAAPADAFVIGGASVYKALLPFCQNAYVTKIEASFPADTYFPNLDKDPDWAQIEEGAPLNEKGVVYRYVQYQRRNC